MDCYDEILEYYHKKEAGKSSQPLEKCFSRFLVRLMKDLEAGKSILDIRNCLILLLNLFFVDYPDYFHKKGKDIDALSAAEKNELFGLLRTEFVRN